MRRPGDPADADIRRPVHPSPAAPAHHDRAAFSVAYLLLASTATHSWVLFVGQLFNATSIAAIQGLGVSYVQDLMPRQPGKASALYGNSFAAGTIMAGPLIASAERFGYRTAYTIAAGICLAGFALIAVSRPPRPVIALEGQPAAESVAA